MAPATSRARRSTAISTRLASSTFADGQWWEVDLGSTRQVDTVSVNWEAAYASQYRISVATRKASTRP